LLVKRRQNLSSIAGIGVRSHRCEQLLSGLGNGSRLLQELGAFGRKKLSDLTKFCLRHRQIGR